MAGMNGNRTIAKGFKDPCATITPHPNENLAVLVGFAPTSYGFRDRCNNCYTTRQCEMAGKGGVEPPTTQFNRLPAFTDLPSYQ